MSIMCRMVKEGIINYRKLPIDNEGYNAPRVLVKNKIWRSIDKVSIGELVSTKNLCDKKSYPSRMDRIKSYIKTWIK